MAVEIERKFLIRSNGWRGSVSSSRHIADYLVATFAAGKARIRFCDDEAVLTFKGRKTGCRRCEHHIPIGTTEARAMIDDFAHTEALERNRHHVDVAGMTWQVDEYLGPLSGLVTADVELPQDDHPLIVPHWAGCEITSDARFGASAMMLSLGDGPKAVKALVNAAEDRGRMRGGDSLTSGAAHKC